MKRRRPPIKNKVVDETINKVKHSVEIIKQIGIRSCPQCQVEFDGVKCCPIQEACGHIKCRACFIKGLGNGDNYCQQCEFENRVEIEPEKNSEHEKLNIKIKNKGKKQHSLQRPRNKLVQQPEPNGTPVPVSLPTSNRISDSLKVTLKIQSKNKRENASRARVKKPKPIEDKRKNHPINCPDHIIKVQPHTEDPVRYKCTVCNKSFKTKAHIKYHAYCSKDGSASIEKPFQCDQCDNSFVSRSHFEYHVRTHTGERPYKCKFCKQGFIQSGKLKRHMRIHNGEKEKPFKCQQCGRGFVYAQGLRSHCLIHTGERPYACQYCPKKFTGMTNLKKHVIIHTGERPFSCSICHKSFGLKWTLNLHLRTHSTDRPFKCNECPRAFSNSKDLRRHLFIHTGERPFKCTICGIRFKRKDNLNRHVNHRHNYETRKMLSITEEASYSLSDTSIKQTSKIKINATNITEAKYKETEELKNTATASEAIQSNLSRASEELITSSRLQLEEVINNVCDDAFIFNDPEVSQIKRDVSEAESFVEGLVRADFVQSRRTKIFHDHGLIQNHSPLMRLL